MCLSLRSKVRGIRILSKFSIVQMQDAIITSLKFIMAGHQANMQSQSTKFQNHENINLTEKLYFFILYNQVYIARHDVKSLHSGFIFRENTSHYKVGG